jgi:hypothetical protein
MGRKREGWEEEGEWRRERGVQLTGLDERKAQYISLPYIIKSL